MMFIPLALILFAIVFPGLTRLFIAMALLVVLYAIGSI